MAKMSIEDKIAQLEARAKTLRARLANQERAKDTRRKILIGALILYRLENNPTAEFSKYLTNWLQRELPGFLTREEDKALFADILEKPTKEPDTEKTDI